jgi:hypothetical protein
MHHAQIVAFTIATVLQPVNAGVIETAERIRMSIYRTSLVSLFVALTIAGSAEAANLKF